VSESEHECFEMDGALVHGDPGMSEEAREAIRQLIDVVRNATPEQLEQWSRKR
jgi:hypothetical protein